MSLIGPNYVVETERGAIVVKFDVRPTLDVRRAVRAHGFEPGPNKYTFRRRDDWNGRCAADYLVRRLGELYGL